MNLKHITSLRACSLALGVSIGIAPAGAAEFEWRMDMNAVETQPTSVLVGEFADRVNANSDGRLEITVFYGGSLGIESADQLRAVRQGSVEMALLYAGFFGRDAPDLSMALVQGVILDPQENLDIQPAIQGIYADFYDEWDVEVVGWTLENTFDIAVMCGDDPINTLEELKGKKLRVWGKDQVLAFEKLGVSAQIIPQNDLYVAMQTGVVDCTLYVLGVAKTISLQEVADYAASLHAYSVVPSAIGVAKRDWDALPDDLKEVVMEAGEWVYEKSKELVLDTSMDDAARAEFAETGELEVLEPFSPADRQAFFEAVSEVWQESAEEIGRRAPEYRQTVVEALEAARSDG